MPVINTGSHPKLLFPGIKRVWGDTYKRFDPIWPKMFEVLTSEKAYEEDVETVGFGLMSIKNQGGGISFDTTQQGYVSRYTALTYALGFQVTFEEVQDNLYLHWGEKRSKKLARSVYETEEIVHANVFNRAFSSSYAGGDGKELCATDHPTVNGNQTNELATAADLSEASVEDLVIQIMNAKDSRGIRFSNNPRCLMVPTALRFEAARLLGSSMRVETANNDINVINKDAVFPEGYVVNRYFTDDDAWFIKTDCPEGLTHYTRMPATFENDNDFSTKNVMQSVVARWSQGWSNWRGLYGSPGA